MNLSAFAAAVLALSVAATAAGPSLSPVVFAPESRFTDLRECRPDAVAERSKPDGDATRACPGFGGARVLLAGEGPLTSIGFAWSSREVAGNVASLEGEVAALEWRGVAGVRGFEPYAVIVRTSSSEDVPARILVLRVRTGEACLSALVSADTEEGTLVAARRLADQEIRHRACERARPPAPAPAPAA